MEVSYASATNSENPAKGAMLEAWQQSLSEARQIAKMVLGRAASTVVAERNRGIYRSVIIGHTRDYIIQQIGKQAAAICREIWAPHFSINGKNSFICSSSGRSAARTRLGALSPTLAQAGRRGAGLRTSSQIALTRPLLIGRPFTGFLGPQVDHALIEASVSDGLRSAASSHGRA
jgi:hypothetical protein